MGTRSIVSRRWAGTSKRPQEFAELVPEVTPRYRSNARLARGTGEGPVDVRHEADHGRWQ